MFARLLLAVLVVCVISQAYGGTWKRRKTDPTEPCDECNMYCSVTLGSKVSGCVCPDNFTCTEVDPDFTPSRRWGKFEKRATFSVCKSDAEVPEHWGPPCKVVGADGAETDIGCPAGFACDVGPISTMTGSTIMFCNYTSSSEAEDNMQSWWDWVCNNQDWSWKDWCFGEEFSFKGSRGREGNRGKPGKRGRRGIGRRNKCKN